MKNNLLLLVALIAFIGAVCVIEHFSAEKRSKYESVYITIPITTKDNNELIVRGKLQYYTDSITESSYLRAKEVVSYSLEEVGKQYTSKEIIDLVITDITYYVNYNLKNENLHFKYCTNAIMTKSYVEKEPSFEFKERMNIK